MDVTYPDINRGLSTEETYDMGLILREVQDSSRVIRDRPEPNWQGATLTPKKLNLEMVPSHTRFTFGALDKRIMYGFEIEGESDKRVAYIWLAHQCMCIPVRNIVTVRDIEVESDKRVKTTYNRGIVEPGYQTIFPYFEPGNSNLEKPTKIISVGCNCLNLVPLASS